MSKVKFICPACGSKNIVGWVEKIIETKYYLNSTAKNGTYLSKRKIPKSTREVHDEDNWGYYCEDCGEWCNENDYNDYPDNWRIEVNKNEN